MIFNIAMAQGLKPAAVDGDVGQADIGPPGFITLGSSDKQVYWLNELQPLSMRFIGDIKPQHYAQLIVCEITRLVEGAHGAGYKVVAVDTDGWVRDEQGLLHKAMLIERLRPDAIFVLGDELKGVFKWATKLGIAVGTELEFVIMVIAVSCVKLLSAHNSTQHTSRKHKV
jgi:Predicted GTPase or GTP-binding protein